MNPFCCKRCARKLAYPGALYCGGACLELWEAGDRGAEPLHVYESDGEMFVAANLEEAKIIERLYITEILGESAEDYRELGDLAEVPDDRTLRVRDEDDKVERRTAGEWAALNGRGLLGTSDY